MNRTVATTLLAVGALTLALTSCSNDPLDVSCKSFMTRSSSEQIALAARWADPTRKTVTAMDQMVARQYADDLRKYCPGHGGDRLKNLELGFGR
jgi:hypothetical protein